MGSRRQCINYGQCALFTIFEKINQIILEKYNNTSQFIYRQGLMALRNISAQYLKSKTKNNSQISLFTFQNNQMIPEENHLCLKKQLIDQPEDISFPNSNEYSSYQTKSEIKVRENSFMHRKVRKKRLSQAQQLRQSLKKMNIQQIDFNKQQSQDQNVQSMDQEIQNNTLKELNQDKNKNLVQYRILDVKIDKQSESSDDSYPLTEYSSNQSSNQHQYDQQIKCQSYFPNQTTVYKISSYSQLQGGSSAYLLSNICHSPIKSKSNKKRTFIRNKKIPRWAQNMQKVKQETYKQRQNRQQFNPKQIYGVCVVQKLDSNIIFNSETNYKRGSSGKWNRYPYNQFIM